ncbi:MAG: ATP-binding protein [Cytophagaceae bacterium]|nr:ATP-binding protein [Cytophagaceae bacterium]
MQFNWQGPASTIAIRDDGRGMSEDELVEALRPGTKGPDWVRAPEDLGRFGLGLKTASFSQCRRLTLLSKPRGGVVSHWSWDLDHVAQTDRWELVQLSPPPELIGQLAAQESGTVVLWEALDRLTARTSRDNTHHLDAFLKAAAGVKEHLSMVFHRFLSDGRVKIRVNDRPLEAWDPFLTGEDATQPLAEETLAEGCVGVKGFVLPHVSKLSPPQHTAAAGPRGWNAQQGFYVYRNERLLVAGDWLGLYRKEEHYKLARIRVDLPASLDQEWQIDIKKSVARPPTTLRPNLQRIADDVRQRAVAVYRHRGKVMQRSLSGTFTAVWIEKLKHGKRFYVINREHPLVQRLLADPDRISQPALLRLIEETVPVPLIALNETEKPDVQARPFEGSAPGELTSALRIVWESLRQHLTEAEARRELHFIEPFNDYPELIAAL